MPNKKIIVPDNRLIIFRKSVIAFANTIGGIILIDVEDDGTITGLNDPGKTQEQTAKSTSNQTNWARNTCREP